MKSTFWGAVSGAVSFGLGELFSAGSVVKALGDAKFLIQAAAHGVSQGVLSVMQGGDFLSGAAGGFLGSLGAEFWSGAMKDMGLIKFANSTIGTVAFGALSGGIGAELSGGNFWQGAVTGGIVAGLNHELHRYADKYIFEKSVEKFLIKLGYDKKEVRSDVTIHKDPKWKNYYARLNNADKYIKNWESSIDSVTEGEAYTSPSLKVKYRNGYVRESTGDRTTDYSLKYYKERGYSIGIVKSKLVPHSIEAMLEIMDGAWRGVTGKDNVIYDMHYNNSKTILDNDLY